MDKNNNNRFIFEQKAIKYLSDIVNTTDLSEIEYKCGDISIKISKKTDLPVQHFSSVAPSYGMHHSASQASAPLPAVVETKAEPAVNNKIEKALVVGRIYLAEKPGAPALIKVGDKVEVGQRIFIIEAMKVMNNIKSSHAGTVKEILVVDGQPVEYGQSLVVLE